MTDAKTPNEKLTALGADVTHTYKDALNEVRPVLNRMTDRAQNSMHELAAKGKDAALSAEHLLEKEARHVHRAAEHYIQDAPLKSVLIAAGTGAATALLAAWFLRSHKN